MDTTATNNKANDNDSSISSIKDMKDNNPPTQKTNKILYIIVGVVSGIVIVTCIVLLVVLIVTKDKPQKRVITDNSIENSKQSLQFLIQGNTRRRRNLQEGEEYIKILGDNFNELNSSNAIMYVDNKTMDFNKNISINASKATTVEIKFLGNLTTFKEMFK